MTLEKGIEIVGKKLPASDAILTDDALSFVAALHRKFNPTREQLLARRAARQLEFDAGKMPDFLPETKKVRESDWKVAATPPDLEKRWVEITGPVERKMMINAFNSGANTFMADFEDSLSPTWENVVEGQQNLIDAVRRTIEFKSPEGKAYRLNPQIAVVLVRPRGWHLFEKHVLVDGKPISASILDFGLYFFHNARELLQRKSGPYFYLPKMESHLEARLWNDVFNAAQDALKIPRGTIRATVLIETLPAAFEMDEILYELRDHASGLNAGRWDYIFSLIKKFRNRADLALPDRVQVTMTVPFMRAYTELLVRTCHRRGAHAMGGMAPFIPSRKNPEINEKALAKVREDKLREANDGFDGTWVAHPDLVPVAMEVFQKALGSKANQKDKLRPEVKVAGSQLVDTHVPSATITEAGFPQQHQRRAAVPQLVVVGQRRGGHLQSDGRRGDRGDLARAAVAMDHEQGAKLDDGTVATRELYEKMRDEELGKIGGREQGRMREAVDLLDSLVLNREFSEFLTLPAYRLFE